MTVRCSLCAFLNSHFGNIPKSSFKFTQKRSVQSVRSLIHRFWIFFIWKYIIRYQLTTSLIKILLSRSCSIIPLGIIHQRRPTKNWLYVTIPFLAQLPSFWRQPSSVHSVRILSCINIMQKRPKRKIWHLQILYFRRSAYFSLMKLFYS